MIINKILRILGNVRRILNQLRQLSHFRRAMYTNHSSGLDIRAMQHSNGECIVEMSLRFGKSGGFGAIFTVGCLGCIVRDNVGDTMMAGHKFLNDDVDITMAEAEAVLFGLQAAKDDGFLNIFVESDNLNIY